METSDVTKNIAIVVGVLALIAVAALAFSVFRTPEEASAPITAATLTIETSAPAAVATELPVIEPTATPEPAAQATAAPAEEATTTAEPAAEPTAAPVEEPTATAQPAAEPAAAPVLFEIVQAESEARFTIDEVLRGSPVTVVGVTDQVAGQIAIDPANPAATQLGQIVVNARTLATDNEFRNRAIRNQILDTNTYEFVTFQPTELVGLPDAVTVGQSFSFQVVGDLTVKDVTQSVTFDVTVTPVSETRIEGVATTTFPYRDFGVRIPEVPSVDLVADDVTLELAFVAVAP
jgi:polyisoprenoid-binding protein YceI